jgi:hypothetical protein
MDGELDKEEIVICSFNENLVPDAMKRYQIQFIHMEKFVTLFEKLTANLDILLVVDVLSEIRKEHQLMYYELLKVKYGDI